MYNFVIYTDGFNSIENMFFLDVKDNPNVKIISKNRVFSNFFIQKIFRIHFSHQIYNKINLPFKKIWYKKLDYHFENNNETIYVFFPSWYFPDFFKYLKAKHSNCKLAFYFGDTVESKLKNIKNMNVNYIKKQFDYVGSYNEGDVKKYGFKFLRMCYSKYPNFDKIQVNIKYDVIFIGAARNRFDQILKCYEQVKKSDLKYFFYIVGVDNYVSDDENFVVTKQIMDFSEYLKYIKKSKCIIEIIDKETDGGTLRFWDAIMYNRGLITNDKGIFKTRYCDYSSIIYTDNFLDFNYAKVKQFDNINYKYAGDNSPKKFLSIIEQEVQ